jgi:hypothetical protein
MTPAPTMFSSKTDPSQAVNLAAGPNHRSLQGGKP